MTQATRFSLAKTPSGRQPVDLSARIPRQSRFLITTMLHLLRLCPFLCGGHRQLALQPLAWRHQLAVYKRRASRPRLHRSARLFWAGLSRLGTEWRDTLVIVTPDTVLRWQRRRFHEHWTTLSGRPTGGRPPGRADSRPWSPAGPRPIRSGALRESMGSSGSSASPWPSAPAPGHPPSELDTVLARDSQVMKRWDTDRTWARSAGCRRLKSFSWSPRTRCRLRSWAVIRASASRIRVGEMPEHRMSSSPEDALDLPLNRPGFPGDSIP